MMRWFLPLLTVLLSAPFGGVAAEVDLSARSLLWTVHTEHSEVEFHLRALGVIGIDGRIGEVHGEIWRDADGDHVELRVPLHKLEMSSEKNRRWALSKEFFDADAHPLLTFQAALSSGDQVPQGTLTGVLQLRGITAPVSVRLSPRNCAPDAKICNVAAQAQVSRRRFGMRSRRFVVSDKVDLNLGLQLRRSESQGK